MADPADAADGILAGRGGRKSLHRTIVTPEGVLLPVELGQRGERAAAFLIDLLIILAILVGLFLLLLLGIYVTKSVDTWLFAAVLLLSFFIRSFYFAFFELRWQGRTPGKRMLGLRVIDRSGGALRADAVLARNLMREVEVFIPITVLASGSSVNGAWGVLLTIVWLGILVLMPLFNRDALRVGDMVAGTWVVVAPKSRLMPDLAGRRTRSSDSRRARRHTFTQEQVNAYGIFELQTLEDVLREKGPNAAKMREEVAKRIMKKIDWQADDGQAVDVDRFLKDFYAALRGRLERKMLFGVRRKDKHDKA